MRPDPTQDLASWCEVEVGALWANLETLRRQLSPGSLLGVVVKSDAYGHGLLPCAREFAAAGADWLVLNSAAEAQFLRRAGIETPLYICGPVFPFQAGAIAQTGARVVLYGPQLARALSQAAGAQPVRVHLKIETGTSRQGLGLDEALELGRLVADLPGLWLEGLTTHYADIEDTTDHRYAQRQQELLQEAVAAFAAAGLGVEKVHAANSAATLLWPQTHASLVRVGIAAYGLWPSRETYAVALQRCQDQAAGWVPQLRPALSWRARLVQVKEVPAGAYIGYGRTFRTTHPTRLGILPVGYYEGYDRRLSNVAHVLVGGLRAPVRGRVCMNMLMVDLTHIPEARAGQVATLLGRDGEEEVSAETLAGWMGTINYEAVSRIHPGQPRLLRRAEGLYEE
ncbi:MAG: alanine racemase [Candidatus Handelsmanbacteria bacterium]|nr:alanine racemase [Candidatus Handelsmanbacteria bacterium]